KGSTLVEVERVFPASESKPAATSAATPAPTDEADALYVQLGAFSARDNAESLRARIAREIEESLDRAIEVVFHQGLFRVRLGPYRSESEASGIIERLSRSLDLKPYIVR